MDTLQRDARRALNNFGLTVAACSLDALIEETGIDVSMQQYVDALTQGYYRAEGNVTPQRPDLVHAVAETVLK